MRERLACSCQVAALNVNARDVLVGHHVLRVEPQNRSKCVQRTLRVSQVPIRDAERVQRIDIDAVCRRLQQRQRFLRGSRFGKIGPELSGDARLRHTAR